MTEKIRSIALGCVWLTFSTIQGQDLSQTLTLIASGGDTPEVVSKAMLPWLDELGFDRLKQALDASEQAQKRSVAEWLSVAWVEEHLQRAPEALAAWKKACASPQNTTSVMQLGLAHALARQRQFDEALKVLSEMDAAKADAHSVQEAVWLIYGMAAENGQRADKLTLPQRMAEQRPDDTELKLLLARQTATKSPSTETVRRAKETLSQAKDAKVKQAWLLLVLDSEMQQGKNQETAKGAQEGLPESQPNSEEEWQLLDRLTRALQQGRRNPTKAGMPAEEEVAEQFKDRAAVVRRMAVSLREAGSTTAAQKVLNLLKEDAEAKKLTADWQEEDGREPQPPVRVPMAAVSKVEGAEKETAAPSWLEEVNKLDQADRLKKLLELWKADTRDQAAALQLIELFRMRGRPTEMQQVVMQTHFSCADSSSRQAWWRQITRRHFNLGYQTLAWWQSMRWHMGGNPAYWEALTFEHDGVSLPALREAARLAPENETTTAFLARKLWRAGYEDESLHLLHGMTTASAQAAARLETALVDLVKSRPHAAARTMFELAGHESLTPGKAVTLGNGLMAWREWADAVLFFEAQRRRFPADYRLAFLHGLALQGSGDQKKAAELFFTMGGFEQEVSQPLEGDLFEESGVRRTASIFPNAFGLERWQQMQLAVSSVQAQVLSLSAWISQQQRHDDLSEYSLTPPTVEQAGAWGMAKLLFMAAELPEAERQAWVQKARTARLPMPELLVAGRIIHDQGRQAVLKLDAEWIESHLDLPWVGPLWLQQASTAAKPEPHEAELALKVSQATLETNAPAALEAALRAWRLAPSSQESFAAVMKALSRSTPENAALLIVNLNSNLERMPLEVRHKYAPPLIEALISLSQKITNQQNQFQSRLPVLHSALLLGAWETAAKLADATLASQLARPAPDSAGAAPALKLLADSSLLSPAGVLSWPPRLQVLNRSSLLTYQDRAMEERGETLLILEEEKPAFLAAGAKIQDWEVKLAWLLYAGSEEGAKKVVHAWLQAQPEDRDAVLAAAGLAAAEKDLPGALNLLYTRMQAQKKPEALLLAQTDYLLAGVYAEGRTGGSMTSRQPVAPPAAHVKRLRKVAADLFPQLQKLPQGYQSRWAAILTELGLKAEADTLLGLARKKADRMEALQNLPWNGADRPYLEYLGHSMSGRDNRVSSYDISRLLTAKQTEQAVELLVGALRMEADIRFFSSRLHSSDLEQWQQIIRRKDLAKSVLAAVEPGKAPTWRRLVQAVHAAEACEAWDQVVAWAEAALKIDTGNQTLKLALASARLRSSGDPAALVDALKKLPPAEGRGSLESLLGTARKTTDFDQRLKLAQAVVRLAEQQPAIMSPTDGTMGQAVSGTFALLSDAVNDREGNSVAPPLYAELDPRQNVNPKQNPSASPATADQLELRKKLFAQFCDVSLKHPEWIRETLRRLTARHLMDGQPEAEVLVEYIKRGLKDQPQQKIAYFNAFAVLGLHLKDGGMRLRLARLALPLLDIVYDDPQRQSRTDSDSNSLAQLIGGEITAAKHPPLWALWECPLDAITGQYQHTAEQLALNKERRALMDELWNATEKLPQLRRQLFPLWAGYRLHFVDRVDEVLAVARGLSSDAPNDISLLRDFVNKAVQSYENPHHVLSAELVEALLRDKSPKLKPEEVEEPISSLIRILTQGRDNQSDPMPPLSAAPEVAEKVLSLDLQARRRAVLSRLTELLGKDHATTPELIFAQFEEALRQNKDVEKILRDIVKLAERKPEPVHQALVALIQAGNGKSLHRGQTNGYNGGAWELNLRLRWFSSTLDLGKLLMKSDAGRGRSQIEWLRYWIMDLIQPNLLAEPPVPPPNGMEPGHGGVYGSTARLYPKHPLLKKRDELLLSGVELAMQQSELWLDEFRSYTALQMVRTPPGTRQLMAVLDKHCASHPERYVSALGKWTDNGAFKSLEARLAGASLMLKALDAWPKNQVAGEFRQSIDNWRRVVLGVHWSGNLLEVPLLPDMPWMLGYNTSQQDWELKEPGTKERHAAWVRVLEKAMTIPGMFGTVFKDVARLHVAQEPEKIIEAASNLSFEDWRSLQSDLVQLFGNEERNASVERRLQWGKLVVQLLPMAAAVEKYAPQESYKPTWGADTLKYLQQMPRDTSGPFRAPPPTVKILAEREALIKKLGNMLLDDPAMAVEGLESFAHRQFAAGATPEATLALARKTLKSDAARLGQRLSVWCSQALSNKDITNTERVWSLQVLLPLAEEWPQESADWLASLPYLLNNLDSSGMAAESVKTLSERLMNAAMRLPPNGRVLADYARRTCTTQEGQQQLMGRLNPLLTQDRARAAAWMQAWWRSGVGGVTVQVAQLALELLKAWPADAAAKELEWAETYIKVLAPPARERDPYYEGMNPGSANQKQRMASPAPSLDAGLRRLQQEALQELRRRKVDQPWMPPLELRLAGHSTLEPKARTEGLRAFFAEPLLAQTLAYCTEVTDIPLAMQARRQNGPSMTRPLMPGEQMPPHGDASEVLDVSRCLLTAAQQAWLNEAALKPLREKTIVQLPIIISMAARRTAEMSNWPSPFPLTGVQESQSTEAKTLLDAWDALTAKDRKAAMTPEELPRALLAQLKAGEKPAALVELVWPLLKEQPAATAAALKLWAQTLDDQQQPLPVFLETGRLAALLAERWTAAEPAPDWLVVLALRWNEGAWAEPAAAKSGAPAPRGMPRGFPPGFPPGFRGMPPRSIPPEETAQYREAKNEVVPHLAAALRRFPGCAEDGYFQALVVLTGHSDRLPPQELASVALAHLQTRPHSVRRIALPAVPNSTPERWSAPPVWEDAVAFLLDQAQQSGKHGELSPEHSKIIRDALAPEAIGFYDALETLATCTAADFPKAAEALMLADPNSRAADCAMWILRSAAQKKADVPAALWVEITRMQEQFDGNGNQDRLLSIALAWLRQRAELKKSDLTQDARDLLRVLLGPDYSREKMLAALKQVPERNMDGAWSGWPGGGGTMSFLRCRWAYHLMETMTAAPELFHTNLELAHETGLAQHPGVLAWLMKASRTRSWHPEYETRWQDWLVKSTLLDDEAVPDARWLLPSDGLAPVWEFAKACGLDSHFKAAATAWLQEQQLKQPGVGRALLLLACQRAHNADLSVPAIEAALAPCRARLQKASTARRAALTAALGALQPDLEAAVKAAPPSSVLHLLPPVAAPPELEALARRWTAGEGIPSSDPTQDIKTRLKPLVAVIQQLLQSGVKQTPAVMAASVKALAAEKWEIPEAVSHMGAEAWITEHLGQELLNQSTDSYGSHSNGRVTVITEGNDDDRRQRKRQVIRFLMQNTQKFTSALLSSGWRSMAFSLLNSDVNTALNGADLSSLLMSILPPKDHGEALLAPDFLAYNPPSLPALEQFATITAARLPGSSLAWASQSALQSRKATLTGAAAPALTPPAAFWSDEATPPAALLAAIRLSNAPPPAAVRARALQAWAILPLINEDRLLNHSLRWLNDVAADATPGAAADSVAEALVFYLRQNSRYYMSASAGSETSLGQRVIRPLLAALHRAGSKEREAELMQAAAASSQLPLEVLLDEWRAAADVPQAVRDWLPRYFHENMDEYRSMWEYAAEDLPQLTRKDETWLASLSHADGDPLPKLTASLVLAALPDATVEAPAIPRAERVKQRLAVLDPSIPNELTALNRFLRLPGCAEELLPELLPLLRRHPIIHEWQAGMRMSADIPRTTQSGLDTRLRARTITLWAAAEALHAANRQPWTQLTAELAKVHAATDAMYSTDAYALRFRPPGTTLPRFWEEPACQTAGYIIKHHLKTKSPPPPVLLSLWDELSAVTPDLQSDDAGPALGVRLALATGTPAGAQDARKRLTGLKGTFRSLPRQFEAAGLCGLATAEKWPLLNELAKSQLDRSSILATAVKAGFITPAELSSLIGQLPPAECADWAAAAADWLDATDARAGCTAFIRKLATLEHTRLAPRVWHLMLQHATFP